jgi:hypothetical protein
MLPAKVTTGARRLLRTRVDRLLRLLRHKATPDMLIATAAWLIGETGWLLDPEHLAGQEGRRRSNHARRTFGVCSWDPACDANAPRGGYCVKHTAQAEKLLRGLFVKPKRKPAAKGKAKRRGRRR